MSRPKQLVDLLGGTAKGQADFNETTPARLELILQADWLEKTTCIMMIAPKSERSAWTASITIALTRVKIRQKIKLIFVYLIKNIISFNLHTNLKRKYMSIKTQRQLNIWNFSKRAVEWSHIYILIRKIQVDLLNPNRSALNIISYWFCM